MAESPIHDCFICHASEDKDAIARPLAEALTEAGYDVWYDEQSMVLGDSLRAKIDQGLAESRFGVVVVSRRFFEKGWPTSELDALFMKEMVGGERLILPIWHNVDEDFLATKSPILVSRLAVPSDPLDKAVAKVIQAIEHRKGAGASAAAIVAAQTPAPGPAVPEPVEMVEDGTRVRLGHTYEEREIYKGEGGHPDGAGWLSVVGGPVRLEQDLIDPTKIKAEDLRDVVIDNQWYGSPLMNRHGLRGDHEAFWARVPEEKGSAPSYWLKIWEDGLMEFGTDLARRAGPFNAEPERIIPTTTVAEYVHDYALLFLKILELVDYKGEAALVATFKDIENHVLGVDRSRYWSSEGTIATEQLDGRPLRGLVNELAERVPAWTKKTMDRLFLAGGFSIGYPEIDDEGRRLGGDGQVIG